MKLSKLSMVIIFLALTMFFSKTVFKRDFALPVENGLFSEDVINEIKDKMDPVGEIYVSAMSMYRDSFSIGLLASESNPDILTYWFTIYNDTPEFMEKNKNQPYKAYKSGTVQYIDVSDKKTIDQAYADIQMLYSHRIEIMDRLSSESGNKNAWYDIRMNENGQNLDQYLFERVTWNQKGSSTYQDKMVPASDLEALKGVKYYTLGNTLDEKDITELKPSQGIFMVYEGSISEDQTETKTLRAIIELEKK